MSDDFEVVSEDDLRQDLAGAVEALADAVNDTDLTRITWTALALAERAQDWAHRTVSVEDTTEARRFLSTDGALFDVTGRAIQFDKPRFPNLAEAFAKGAEGASGLGADLAGMAAALGDAETVTELHMYLRAALNRWGGPDAAAKDADLADRWKDAELETRAALLLLLAWRSRHTSTLDESDPYYAAELNSHARTWTDDEAEFFGDRYPNMPLPGPAGALATSVGFDRDEAEDGTSLTCALVLAAASPEEEA